MIEQAIRPEGFPQNASDSENTVSPGSRVQRVIMELRQLFKRERKAESPRVQAPLTETIPVQTNPDTHVAQTHSFLEGSTQPAEEPDTSPDLTGSFEPVSEDSQTNEEIPGKPEPEPETDETKRARFKEIFTRTCGEIPDTPQEVTYLKDMDVSGREAPVQIAPDGLRSKTPATSRIEVHTEGDVIKNLQEWQTRMGEMLREIQPEELKEAASFEPEEARKTIDNIIYLGNKELQAGAQVLAKRLIAHVLEGKQVFVLNENYQGASNEYVSLMVLEQLSGIVKNLPLEMQEYIRNNIKSYNSKNHRDGGYTQALNEAIKKSSDPIIVCFDDWRISGVQIQRSIGTAQNTLRNCGIDADPSRIEVNFLFEASNRSYNRGDNPHHFSDGRAYTDSRASATVFAAYTGEIVDPHRQPLSGIWSVVDYGFQDNKLLNEYCLLHGIEPPLALKVIRPTATVPEAYSTVYQDKALRQRYFHAFSEWSSIGPVSLTEQSTRKVAIFDAAREGNLGVDTLKTVDEATAYVEGISLDELFAQSISRDILVSVPLERFKRMVRLDDWDTNPFGAVRDIIKDKLIERMSPLISEEVRSDEMIRKGGFIHSLVIDRIARTALAEIKKPPPLSPEEVTQRIDQNYQKVTSTEGRRTRSYYVGKEADMGEELQQAEEIYFKHTDEGLVCAIEFDSQTDEIPYESEYKKRPDGDISINKRAEWVSITIVDKGDFFDSVTPIARFLAERGFGEQFHYSWQGHWTMAKTFHNTPQEILNASPEQQELINKTRLIGERTRLRDMVNQALENKTFGTGLKNALSEGEEVAWQYLRDSQESLAWYIDRSDSQNSEWVKQYVLRRMRPKEQQQ